MPTYPGQRMQLTSPVSREVPRRAKDANAQSGNFSAFSSFEQVVNSPGGRSELKIGMRDADPPPSGGGTPLSRRNSMPKLGITMDSSEIAFPGLVSVGLARGGGGAEESTSMRKTQSVSTLNGPEFLALSRLSAGSQKVGRIFERRGKILRRNRPMTAQTGPHLLTTSTLSPSSWSNL